MAIPKVATIWLDGAVVDWDDARVHVLSPTLQHGFGVVEDLRAVPTPRGPAVVLHRAHVERLARAAQILAMPLPHRPDELMDATRELCRTNGHDSYRIRVLAHLDGGDLDLPPAGLAVRVAIAAWPWRPGPRDERGGGIRTLVSSWSVPPPTCLPTGARVTGGHVPAGLARLQAHQAGYDDSILLTAHGRVATATTDDVLVVSDGVLIAPPAADGLLPGIARQALLDLARDHDIPTREATLLRHDLYAADEVLLVGALAGITPVRSVDDRPIAAPGPVTRELQRILAGVVGGHDPKYDHLLDYVAQ